MMQIDPKKVYNYSICFEAPCGQGVVVWSNYHHRECDQLEKHIEGCVVCQKKISVKYRKEKINNIKKLIKKGDK